MIGQLPRAVPLGAEIDPDRSGREAEHRDADDEKCEVIPGCDGDDPGFDDLQHQGCCGDQAEACIERQSLRNLLQSSSPYLGGSIAALAIQSAERSRQAHRQEIRRRRTFPQIESDVSLAAKQSGFGCSCSSEIEAEVLDRADILPGGILPGGMSPSGRFR